MSEPVDKLTFACDLVEALNGRIAELDKERDELKYIIIAHQVADETGYIDGDGWVENYSEMSETVSKLLEAHNLEQKAKGISTFADLHLSGHSLFKSLSANYCTVLLLQAKQLREGVDHE